MAATGAEQTRLTGQTAGLVINVSSPFRLDYVAWALRRRAHNEVDRFHAGCYQRVLSLAGEPAEVAVRQNPSAGTPSLIAELRGPAEPAGRTAVAAARPVLERMLGPTMNLGGFHLLLDALAARGYLGEDG